MHQHTDDSEAAPERCWNRSGVNPDAGGKREDPGPAGIDRELPETSPRAALALGSPRSSLIEKLGAGRLVPVPTVGDAGVGPDATAED